MQAPAPSFPPSPPFFFPSSPLPPFPPSSGSASAARRVTLDSPFPVFPVASPPPLFFFFPSSKLLANAMKACRTLFFLRPFCPFFFPPPRPFVFEGELFPSPHLLSDDESIAGQFFFLSPFLRSPFPLSLFSFPKPCFICCKWLVRKFSADLSLFLIPPFFFLLSFFFS